MHFASILVVNFLVIAGVTTLCPCAVTHQPLDSSSHWNNSANLPSSAEHCGISACKSQSGIEAAVAASVAVLFAASSALRLPLTTASLTGLAVTHRHLLRLLFCLQ